MSIFKNTNIVEKKFYFTLVIFGMFIFHVFASFIMIGLIQDHTIGHLTQPYKYIIEPPKDIIFHLMSGNFLDGDKMKSILGNNLFFLNCFCTTFIFFLLNSMKKPMLVVFHDALLDKTLNLKGLMKSFAAFVTLVISNLLPYYFLARSVEIEAKSIIYSNKVFLTDVANFENIAISFVFLFFIPLIVNYELFSLFHKWIKDLSVNKKAIQIFDDHIKMDEKIAGSFQDKNDVFIFKHMVLELLAFDENKEKNKRFEKYEICDVFKDYDLTLKGEWLNLIRIERHHIKRTLESNLEYEIKSDNVFLSIYDILVEQKEHDEIITKHKEAFDALEQEIETNFKEYQALIDKNKERIKEHKQIEAMKFEFLISSDDVENSFNSLMEKMKAHNGQIKKTINLLKKDIQKQLNKIKEQEKSKM